MNLGVWPFSILYALCLALPTAPPPPSLQYAEESFTQNEPSVDVGTASLPIWIEAQKEASGGDEEVGVA